MDDGEGVARVAHGAQGGLHNPAAVDLHSGRIAAHVAAEESLAHFRDDVAGPDNHAANSDELIDIYGKTGEWKRFTTSAAFN